MNLKIVWEEEAQVIKLQKLYNYLVEENSGTKDS